MRAELDRVKALLIECTARIAVAGVHAGTAFFVGPQTLLTCAHVVAADDGTLFNDVSVEWRCNSAWTRLPAPAIELAAHADLALLTFPSEVVLPDHPCVWLSELVSGRDPLSSFGYPSGYENGDTATFEVEGGSFKGDTPLLKLKNGQADWGASGSPILNERLRSVCAVLTLSRDVNSALGGRATPIEQAFAQWPQLSGLQLEAHEKNRRWAELMPLPLWKVAARAERERLFRSELNQRPLDSSPLRSAWQSFVALQPWHARVAAVVNRLAHLLVDIPDAPALPAINFSANYDAIAATMREISNGNLLDWMQSSLDKLEAAEQNARSEQKWDERERANELTHRIRDAKKVLGGLADEVSEPCYDKCFLVLGDSGAGKTHFLTSLLDQDQHLVLLLRPSQLSRKPLSDYLLDAIRELTRTDWDNLAEFDSYLCGFNPPHVLIIAIDDLQTMGGEQFLAELEEFVSHHTQLHSVFHLFTIDHQSYFQVSGLFPFWSTYAYLSAEADRIGPWLHLDELNNRNRTGIGIIRRAVASDADGGKKLLSGLERSSAVTQALLTRPFVAWVLLDIREHLDVVSIVDLNFVNFISHFWEDLLPRLAKDTPGQNRLTTCVNLISTFLLEQGEFMPEETALRDYLIQKAKSRSDLADGTNAQAALLSLASGGLLRTFESDDPDFGPVHKLELAFPIFWNWKIAGRLLRELETALNQKSTGTAFLEQWFEKHPAISRDGAGIVEFLLLLLDQQQQALFDTVWQWAAFSPKAPGGGAWFAAAKASAGAKARVATTLIKDRPALRDESRDLFGFTYFLASLSTRLPEDVSAPELLRLLSWHYSALAAASLGDYFAYTVRKCLPCCKDKDEVTACMFLLTGCEVMGVAKQVATLSLDVLEKRCKNDAALAESVMQYLKSISHEWLQDEKPGGRERYFYREWVTTEFGDRLIDRNGTDAYGILAAAGWYDGESRGIRRILAREMIKYTNFAFADWYRSTSPLPRQEYASLVEQLAHSSNLVECEAAFYMIRHTRATHAEAAVRVDEVFHPILKDLAQNPRLARLRSRSQAFFRINNALTDRV